MDGGAVNLWCAKHNRWEANSNWCGLMDLFAEEPDRSKEDKGK
jgi:hypothetical protein